MSPQDKAPAYQWYVRDFMSDEAVALMSYEQQGIYRALLDRQWLEGSIPADPSQLAAILRLPVGRFSRLWPQISVKFSAVADGRLANARMEREREKADAYRELQRQKGLRSGQARTAAQPKTNHGSTAVAPRLEPNGNSSSASSSTSASTPTGERETAAAIVTPFRRNQGAMGGGYAAQSMAAVAAAWSHPKGFTLSAGRYYSKLLANFDGNVPELHAWMDRKVDEHLSAGGKVGDLFKFFDAAIDTDFGLKVTQRERAMNEDF